MKGFTLIHGIAECQDCDWAEADHIGNITWAEADHIGNITQKARYHAKKHKHNVSVELGFSKNIKGDADG